jgi:hypothetical protein
MAFLTTLPTQFLETSLVFLNSGGNTTIVAANPSAGHTLTVPDAGGSDTFMMLAASQTFSGKTLGGNLAAGGFKVTGAADPTASGDYATKNYVDNTVVGLDIHAACMCATTTALPAGTYVGTPTFTFTVTATGTLTIDGYLTALNDRILVKNQATASQNGIYVVTTAGAIGVAAVLTRATDYDTSAQVEKSAFTFVTTGSVNGGQGFVATPGLSAVLDTTSISFSQFSGGQVYSQGNGISISSNIITAVGDGTSITVTGSGIGILSTWAGQAAITTVGTISSGTWAGTAVGTTHGGTGATSASGGFNNLSPITTTGDLIIGNGSSSATRLGIGANHTVLYSGGSTASWANIDSAAFGSNILAVAQGGTGNATVSANTAFGNFTGSTAAPGFGTVSIGAGGTGAVSASTALANLGGYPLQPSLVSQSANFTQGASDYITQVTTSTSTITATLVTASSSNKWIPYIIMKKDNGTGKVLVTPASGTINGLSNWPILTQYDSLTVYNDGTNWFVA